MIIDLKTIPQDAPKHLELCLEKGWWQPDRQDDQIIGISNTIVVSVEMYKVGLRYVLEGNMSGSIKILCDRCLNDYDTEIKTSFKLFFTHQSQYTNKVEVELLEEDLETGFINDEKIDLDDILREQLYLALPIKSLCREDCLGLCPSCGMNLNIESCQCNK